MSRIKTFAAAALVATGLAAPADAQTRALDRTQASILLACQTTPDQCRLSPDGRLTLDRDGITATVDVDCRRYAKVCRGVETVDYSPVRCLRQTKLPPAGQLPADFSGTYTAYQQFPATGPMQTAWAVAYDHGTSRGLYLGQVWFKPGPDRPWVKVLHEAGLSDIFVPYAPGQPRYFDLTGFAFDLEKANEADRGGCGAIVGQGAVIREVSDKGPLWKDDQAVHRGQKMSLWATMDAANYNYIIRYEFHDDGQIALQMAGTAANLPGAQFTPHTHNALWRIDVDLDGADGDSVHYTRHLEPTGSPSWQNVVEPFNGGTEGAIEFVPQEFTQVQIRDANLVNPAGRPAFYDLRPVYRGVVRHQEQFMRHDFWATRFSGSQRDFTQLNAYANGESVSGEDIVLWQVTPLLHVPRSEDGRFVNGYWEGVALAMWGEVQLRPRNLFDGTPFYDGSGFDPRP